MKREQQQAQVQMALQLLQMLREGRNQSERTQLMREQMQNEMQMGRRQTRMNRDIKERELEQMGRQFDMSQSSNERKYQFDIEEARRAAEVDKAKFEQAERLSMAERNQAMELAKMQQAALLQQAQAKNEGLMNPQILDYIQKTMMMPPGAEREALMGNLETMTGKTFQRPVDQFQQLVNPNK